MDLTTLPDLATSLSALEAFETLRASSRSFAPDGVAPSAFVELEVDAGDFDMFFPHYLKAYGESVREEKTFGTTTSRPLVLVEARIGNIAMLRRMCGPRNLDRGICCHNGWSPTSWSPFASLHGQKLRLTFFNPNETYVHAQVEILGGPPELDVERPPALAWVGATSLKDYPEGLPPNTSFTARLTAGDACQMTPAFIAAHAYEYAFARERKAVEAEVFPQPDHPVLLEKGWVGNRPLIEDQERKPDQALVLHGFEQVDWPSFTSLSRQGLDLVLRHQEDTPMHVFLNLYCKLE